MAALTKTKKQKAVEAYNSLIGLIDGDYGSEAETQISNADVIDRSSNSDAWQDLQRIQFDFSMTWKISIQVYWEMMI